jgi:hypothetical protein
MLDDDSAKTSNWDSLHIAHCLELSLAETPKNEDLLIAACHFWSNGVNAFLFGHGPMSPTLADVYMITGLDTTGSVYPHNSSSWQTRVKKQELDIRGISKNICLMALCLKLSTWPF